MRASARQATEDLPRSPYLRPHLPIPTNMGPDLLDPDLIACLYSYGGDESEKVVREMNPSRYRPTLPSSHVDYDPKAREATASPKASVAGHDEPGSDPAHLNAPHLELRFSQGPRTGCGFVLGRDPAKAT